MTTPNARVTLRTRRLYGSSLRCLLLTHQPDGVVARLLTELVQPYAVVDADRDRWMPRGFEEPDETVLGKSNFLSEARRDDLMAWWLAVPRPANTLNCDIASTCTVGGRRGLVLVEAKAHKAELGVGDTCKAGAKNLNRITEATADASKGLAAVLPGFSLSVNSHYQLSNRFAWSWKIAALGVPVILVYLGFLNAEDMDDRGRETFDSASAWEAAVRDYARDIVPGAAWNRKLDIEGTPVYPLIRSMELRWSQVRS